MRSTRVARGLLAGLLAGSLGACSTGSPSLAAGGPPSSVAAPRSTAAAGSGTAAPASAVPTSPSAPRSPAAVAAAGSAEAATAAQLAPGKASGSVDITYDGLGEARSPFTGTCTRTGGSTRLDGTAGTAHVTLTFGPTGTTLLVDDVGMRSSASVAAGGLGVEGNRLRLDTPLLQDHQSIGRVQVDLSCS